MEWLVLILVAVMLIAALSVLLLPNLMAALAAASVVSLALSILFVVLRAPDVAMTEAAVGAGLSSLILAIGLRKLNLWKLSSDRGENLLDRHRNSSTAGDAKEDPQDD